MSGETPSFFLILTRGRFFIAFREGERGEGWGRRERQRNRERERERERERDFDMSKKHQSVAFHRLPNRGPNP